MDVIGHEESAALNVFAQLGALFRSQSPLAYLNGVDPRPVEHVVVVETDNLFGGANVDAGEAPHGLRQMAVGARIILGPERKAEPVVALKPRIVTVQRAPGKHEAREHPFGRHLRVGRQGKVVVFDGGVFAEWLLESMQGA